MSIQSDAVETALRAQVEGLTRESAGRLKVLEEKAAEAKTEWLRAEQAEQERNRAEERVAVCLRVNEDMTKELEAASVRRPSNERKEKAEDFRDDRTLDILRPGHGVCRPMWPPHGMVDSAPCADCGRLIDLRVCLGTIANLERIAKEERAKAEEISPAAAFLAVERVEAKLARVVEALHQIEDMPCLPSEPTALLLRKMAGEAILAAAQDQPTQEPVCPRAGDGHKADCEFCMSLAVAGRDKEWKQSGSACSECATMLAPEETTCPVCSPTQENNTGEPMSNKSGPKTPDDCAWATAVLGLATSYYALSRDVARLTAEVSHMRADVVADERKALREMLDTLAGEHSPRCVSRDRILAVLAARDQPPQDNKPEDRS